LFNKKVSKEKLSWGCPKAPTNQVHTAESLL